MHRLLTQDVGKDYAGLCLVAVSVAILLITQQGSLLLWPQKAPARPLPGLQNGLAFVDQKPPRPKGRRTVQIQGRKKLGRGGDVEATILRTETACISYLRGHFLAHTRLYSLVTCRGDQEKEPGKLVRSEKIYARRKKGGLRCLGELASPSQWEERAGFVPLALTSPCSSPLLMRILAVHTNWFIRLFLAPFSLTILPSSPGVVGRNERPVAQSCK